MKTHYTEADLLETYYMQPGESMPVMLHLASCRDCAKRYDSLERKLREAASCTTHDRPETFWTRQRLTIQRRIGQRKERSVQVAHLTRIAAAAVLAFFLGGVTVYRHVEPQVARGPQVINVQQQVPAATAATPATTDELQVPRDPWQSDELADFHSVVAWESWDSDGKGSTL
jgi:hypothetical protein